MIIQKQENKIFDELVRAYFVDFYVFHYNCHLLRTDKLTSATVIKFQAIWPYSGHYHPTEANFREFTSFLEEHHVDLSNVKVKILVLNNFFLCENKLFLEY